MTEDKAYLKKVEACQLLEWLCAQKETHDCPCDEACGYCGRMDQLISMFALVDSQAKRITMLEALLPAIQANREALVLKTCAQKRMIERMWPFVQHKTHCPYAVGGSAICVCGFHLLLREIDPQPKPETLKRSCNRHKDCGDADAKVMSSGSGLRATHCNDDDCEDCFGQ